MKIPPITGCFSLFTVLLTGFLVIFSLVFGLQNSILYFNSDNFVPDTLTNIKLDSYRTQVYLKGILKSNNKEVEMHCGEKLAYKYCNERDSLGAENYIIPIWYFSKRYVYYRDSEVYDKSLFIKSFFKDMSTLFFPALFFGLLWLWQIKKKKLEDIKQLRTKK